MLKLGPGGKRLAGVRGTMGQRQSHQVHPLQLVRNRLLPFYAHAVIRFLQQKKPYVCLDPNQFHRIRSKYVIHHPDDE